MEASSTSLYPIRLLRGQCHSSRCDLESRKEWHLFQIRSSPNGPEVPSRQAMGRGSFSWVQTLVRLWLRGLYHGLARRTLNCEVLYLSTCKFALLQRQHQIRVDDHFGKRQNEALRIKSKLFTLTFQILSDEAPPPPQTHLIPFRLGLRVLVCQAFFLVLAHANLMPASGPLH